MKNSTYGAEVRKPNRLFVSNWSHRDLEGNPPWVWRIKCDNIVRVMIKRKAFWLLVLRSVLITIVLPGIPFLSILAIIELYHAGYRIPENSGYLIGILDFLLMMISYNALHNGISVKKSEITVKHKGRVYYGSDYFSYWD